MKIVIDMNLSPEWKDILAAAGWDAVHWRDIGDGRAPDVEILAWAAENNRIVFTQDLDFGALLAASGARAPSVFQLRAQDMLPDDAADRVVAAFHRFEPMLREGAFVTVDPVRARARVLPIA